MVASRLLASMLSQIRSSYISQSCADEDVRGVMPFRRVARETHSSCKRIRSPLEPIILGISVSDHRRKCKTCGCVSGRKGPSAAPELACTAWFERKLTVERELEG